MSRWLAPARAYAAEWERLSPATLPALGALLADDIRFKDPFNDVRGRPETIEGMSEIRFAADGRVVSHVDHWDAAGQLYEKLPVLGALTRFLRMRLAAKA